MDLVNERLSTSIGVFCFLARRAPDRGVVYILLGLYLGLRLIHSHRATHKFGIGTISEPMEIVRNPLAVADHPTDPQFATLAEALI